MDVIRFNDVSYCYDDGIGEKKVAIKNITFNIPHGEYLCIIGHTGSGKTTLLKHLNCMLKPTSGEVLINGVDVWKERLAFKELSREIGFVFQNPAYQLFEETVEKDIAFGPKNLGYSQEEIKKRVDMAAEVVGLDSSILKKSPFEISGGQKRRVAIAGVIATTPKILLLDEPTSGLDPVGKNKILEIIRRYNKEFKATVVVVTHNMEDVFMYASRVLVLKKGEIFSFADVEQTFKKAEKLQEIGLDIPDISKVFLELFKKGFLVPSNIYSVEKAAKVVKNIFIEKEKRC